MNDNYEHSIENETPLILQHIAIKHQEDEIEDKENLSEDNS